MEQKKLLRELFQKLKTHKIVQSIISDWIKEFKPKTKGKGFTQGRISELLGDDDWSSKHSELLEYLKEMVEILQDNSIYQDNDLEIPYNIREKAIEALFDKNRNSIEDGITIQFSPNEISHPESKNNLKKHYSTFLLGIITGIIMTSLFCKCSYIKSSSNIRISLTLDQRKKWWNTKDTFVVTLTDLNENLDTFHLDARDRGRLVAHKTSYKINSDLKLFKVENITGGLEWDGISLKSGIITLDNDSYGFQCKNSIWVGSEDSKYIVYVKELTKNAIILCD